jgi:hypothetical protein
LNDQNLRRDKCKPAAGQVNPSKGSSRSYWQLVGNTWCWCCCFLTLLPTPSHDFERPVQLKYRGLPISGWLCRDHSHALLAVTAAADDFVDKHVEMPDELK